MKKSCIFKINRDVLLDLICFFGSQQKTGEVLGVSQQTVSKWVKSEKMPAFRIFQAEKKTRHKFKVEKLCDDFYEKFDNLLG